MIKNKITQDQIAALKNHDSQTVSTLRYILAQIKNKEIEEKKELTDDGVMTILRKLSKELNESITAFSKGNRKDLVNEYEKQLKITSSYLPPEMPDGELKKEIAILINQNKELYEKNPKAIIGVVMKKLKEKASPSRILSMLQNTDK